MRPPFTKAILLVITSAALCAMAIMFVQFYLAWLALIPFFVAIHNAKPRKALWSGLTFGIVFGAIMLYWMVGLVSDFSGKAIYGLIFYGIGLLLSALYFGLLATAISWLTKGKRPLWLNALLASSLWCLGEWIYSSALPGMPWFGLFRVSNMVLGNLYAIQASTLGGAFFISFFIVLVNYLAAGVIPERKWKWLLAPATILVAYLLLGYGLLYYFKQHAGEDEKITIAILRENAPPGLKWNEENGSSLVKKLFELNREGLAARPDIALWSESIVPWTYRPDDDFVNEILKAATGTGTTYIIGMMSDYSKTEVYNSAYAVSADGQVSGRYDKRFPVSFAEMPVAFWSLPFAGSNDRPFEKPGENLLPLPTPKGKAGVLICNDGTVPGATVGPVSNGAVFLVSLSNDAWFSHVDFLVRQHFYNTRLRAVEVRKDLAVNCNMGFSGLVKASGELAIEGPETNTSIQTVAVSSNKFLTVYTSYSYWFIYATALFVFTFIALNFVHYIKPN